MAGQRKALVAHNIGEEVLFGAFVWKKWQLRCTEAGQWRVDLTNSRCVTGCCRLPYHDLGIIPVKTTYVCVHSGKSKK